MEGWMQRRCTARGWVTEQLAAAEPVLLNEIGWGTPASDWAPVGESYWGGGG